MDGWLLWSNGTSITQGGFATRPGMAYPALIGRNLDIPTANLGFSGNGRGEHEVSDLLAELDPSAYVIDAMPNMSADTVDGVHPTDIGFLRMAEVLMPAVKKALAHTMDDK